MAFKTKIALGGGCHWCTEAVFQSLLGVFKVEQGFVASNEAHKTFSEAVIVHFNHELITLKTLIEVHLHTHKSTSDHSMRKKYRSAVYYFSDHQKIEAELVLNDFQVAFKNRLIVKLCPFEKFKPSAKNFHNYYLKNSKKPFCERFINPKLELIQQKFSNHIKREYIESSH